MSLALGDTVRRIERKENAVITDKTNLPTNNIITHLDNYNNKLLL